MSAPASFQFWSDHCTLDSSNLATTYQESNSLVDQPIPVYELPVISDMGSGIVPRGAIQRRHPYSFLPRSTLMPCRYQSTPSIDGATLKTWH
ncbi:MAG: hypothetical protein IIT36_04145 [Aeriscardovia sp.]|nr:hypothetical protein [Aeriscardovia sp.]